MKVADLIDDLETGDRSMEHLTKSDVNETGLTLDGLRRAVSSLGQGLGNALGQAQMQNPFWNMNAQQHAVDNLAAMQYANVQFQSNTIQQRRGFFGGI